MQREISPDDDGMTQLMAVAAEGKLQAVQELIASGADVNETGKWRGTALMYAALNQHAEIVKILLAAGANPLVRTHKGLSALDFAKMGKSKEIISCLKTAVDEHNAVANKKRAERNAEANKKRARFGLAIDFGELTPTWGERVVQFILWLSCFVDAFVILLLVTGKEPLGWTIFISGVTSAGITYASGSIVLPRVRARLRMENEYAAEMKRSKENPDISSETDYSDDTTNEYSQASTKGDREHTWYEILGVSPTATLDQIKKAYRDKIVQYHPDKVTNLGPELKEVALRMSQKINSAYSQAKELRQGSG